jgi:hypothetical protein
MARALVFRAGTRADVCAATEVELAQTAYGSVRIKRTIRECDNPATEIWETTTGSKTGLCVSCSNRIRASMRAGFVPNVLKAFQRPKNN